MESIDSWGNYDPWEGTRSRAQRGEGGRVLPVGCHAFVLYRSGIVVSPHSV
jgi:hypothetical protein